MTREEKRVIRAVTGKQWGLLALWIEQGCPFGLSKRSQVAKDIRKLEKAVAALQRKKGKG